jgi:hypothetical protein
VPRRRWGEHSGRTMHRLAADRFSRHPNEVSKRRSSAGAASSKPHPIGTMTRQRAAADATRSGPGSSLVPVLIARRGVMTWHDGQHP